MKTQEFTCISVKKWGILSAVLLAVFVCSVLMNGQHPWQRICFSGSSAGNESTPSFTDSIASARLVSHQTVTVDAAATTKTSLLPSRTDSVPNNASIRNSHFCSGCHSNRIEYDVRSPILTQSTTKVNGEVTQQVVLPLNQVNSAGKGTNGYDVYAKRLLTLQRTCKKYHPKYTAGRFWGHRSNRRLGKPKFCSTSECPVIVDHAHKLFFCFNLKVGSTAVKDLFLRLKEETLGPINATSITNLHEKANELLHRVSTAFYPRHKLKEFFKVMFVRHPFVRLVSAFKDKSDRSTDDHQYFYENYWKPIMQHKRGADNVTSDSQPTFAEFVQYLVENPVSEFNGHWEPYWFRCSPCVIPYDLIGKLETAERDFAHMLHHIRANSTVMPLMNSNGGGTSIEETKAYFQTVRPKDILKLYKKFYLDFEMFGYTLQDIF